MSTPKSTATRRRFFGHAGTALLAPLAAAPALAGTSATDETGARRLADLEAADAVRALQRRYIRLVNAGPRSELAALFADQAAAALDTELRRIAPEATLEPSITVDASGTVVASWPCSVELATPIAGDATLVEMARLQGDGVVLRTERRILDGLYANDGAEWKIVRLTFRPA
jgi:hypothetical protein